MEKSEQGSKKKFLVVFVLGGPGSGKGTQCDLITKRFPAWTHLSAGDLLRAERKKSDSELSTMINDIMARGAIVPSSITVTLLRNAMVEKERDDNAAHKFIIDGFPRSKENIDAWNDDEVLCRDAKVEFVLFLNCPEDVMTSRLVRRGESSGRVDDNLDVIRKRFETFQKTSMPVVLDYEEKMSSNSDEAIPLRRLEADRTVEEVFVDVEKLFVDL